MNSYAEMEAAGFTERERVLWGTAMGELHRMQGNVAVDDAGMFPMPAADLITWVGDLEARVGLDVDDFRAAIFDYVDERDTRNALALIKPLETGDWTAVPHDPRGCYVAGAELENLKLGLFVGLYLDDEGDWLTRSSDNDDVAIWTNKGGTSPDFIGALQQMRADLARIGVAP